MAQDESVGFRGYAGKHLEADPLALPVTLSVMDGLVPLAPRSGRTGIVTDGSELGCEHSLHERGSGRGLPTEGLPGVITHRFHQPGCCPSETEQNWTCRLAGQVASPCPVWLCGAESLAALAAKLYGTGMLLVTPAVSPDVLQESSRLSATPSDTPRFSR